MDNYSKETNEYGETYERHTFTRRGLGFTVSISDHDGETGITVDVTYPDGDTSEDFFGGYRNDTTDFCPVQAARAFVGALIDRFDPNRPSLEERLAPYGEEWQLEQDERRSWGVAV